MRVLSSLLIFSFLVSVGNSASQFEKFDFVFNGCSKDSNSITNAKLSQCSTINIEDCVEGSFLIENTHGDQFVATHFTDSDCSKAGNKIKFECTEDHGVEIDNGFYKVTCYKNFDCKLNQNQQQQQQQKKNFKIKNIQDFQTKSNKNLNVFNEKNGSYINASSSSSSEQTSIDTDDLNYSSSSEYYSEEYFSENSEDSDYYSNYDDDDYSEEYSSDEIIGDGGSSYSSKEELYPDSLSYSNSEYDPKIVSDDEISSTSNKTVSEFIYLNNNNFKKIKNIEIGNSKINNQINNLNSLEIHNKLNSENVHTQYSDSLYVSSESYDSLDPDHNSMTSQDYRNQISQDLNSYEKQQGLDSHGKPITNQPTQTPSTTGTSKPTTQRPTTPTPTQTPTQTPTVTPTQTPSETAAFGSSASTLVSNLSLLFLSLILINFLI